MACSSQTLRDTVIVPWTILYILTRRTILFAARLLYHIVFESYKPFNGQGGSRLMRFTVQHSHGQKVRIPLLMNCVNAAMFLGSADPTMDEVLHRGRQGSSRLGLFWGIFSFSFWWKSLTGQPNLKIVKVSLLANLGFFIPTITLIKQCSKGKGLIQGNDGK